MDMRERLRKAAGLFVEIPPDAHDLPQEDERESTASTSGAPPARTVEQIVREADGPNLEEIRVSPIISVEEKPDFAAIYRSAGLTAAPFTAEQMLDMLQSLPMELPLAMKRQTVAVTLGAMGKSIGATPETIVTDASRKMAALTAYTEALSSRTAQTVSAAQQEIADLEAQIRAKREAMTGAQAGLGEALQICHAELDRLDDVLEFFSLDIPPSKQSGEQGKTDAA